MWLKTHKWNLIAGGLILAALAAAFLAGGPVGQGPQEPDAAGLSDPAGENSPEGAGRQEQPPADEKMQDGQKTSGALPPGAQSGPAGEPQNSAEKEAGPSQTPDGGGQESGGAVSDDEKDAARPTEPDGPTDQAAQEPDGQEEQKPQGPDGQEEPGSEDLPAKKPESQDAGQAAYSCTISISCRTLADNLELLPEEKRSLVPEGGWLLEPTTVTFYEGESVFNVLSRVCKEEKIHLEFSTTPVYNSAYIEGIGNIYEFDAGSLSGWMYQVGGWFPNYGCSRYQLSGGDEIAWVYTCDLGEDVGGSDAAAGQKE